MNGCLLMQILKDEIRNSIHQAALKEFNEKGFKGASMRSIAEKSGIAAGNLYRYFKSKEDLFYTVISPAYQKIIELTEEKYPGLNNSEEGHKFVEHIANQLILINREYRVELMILLEGCHGTRFEQVLEEIVTLVENKFKSDIFPSRKDHDLTDEEGVFFAHVLSTNIINGIIYIIKHCEDELKMGRLIRKFINYHLHDILKRSM